VPSSSLTKDLESKLHERMIDAHALEKSVLRQLDTMIDRMSDIELKKALIAHRLVTREQIERLEARLRAHHESPSAVKDMGRQFTAFLASVRDLFVVEDKLTKQAEEAFLIEHLEIAVYGMLERLALRAGDPETAQVALQSRAEEEAMAGIIVASWDRLVDEGLAEEGLLSQSIGP
jgi:ferritin-like metal-binding protein YciE